MKVLANYSSQINLNADCPDFFEYFAESYPKCIVKCCKNYFDKTRLHLIGVDFEDVPKEPERLAKWEQQIKKSTYFLRLIRHLGLLIIDWL